MQTTHHKITGRCKKDLTGPFISRFEATILFVECENKTLHITLDLWALSKLAVKNRYPLLSIDELLDHCRLPGLSSVALCQHMIANVLTQRSQKPTRQLIK